MQNIKKKTKANNLGIFLATLIKDKKTGGCK